MHLKLSQYDVGDMELKQFYKGGDWAIGIHQQMKAALLYPVYTSWLQAHIIYKIQLCVMLENSECGMVDGFQVLMPYRSI